MLSNENTMQSIANKVEKEHKALDKDDIAKSTAVKEKAEATKEKILELGGTEVFENNILAASWIDDIATP